MFGRDPDDEIGFNGGSFIGAILDYTYNGTYQNFTNYRLRIRATKDLYSDDSELELHEEHAKLTGTDEVILKSHDNKIVLMGPEIGDTNSEYPIPNLVFRGKSSSFGTGFGAQYRDFTIKYPFQGMSSDVNLELPDEQPLKGSVLMTDPNSNVFNTEKLVWYRPFEEFRVQDLADVELTDTDQTRANNAALIWNSTTEAWEAGTIGADLANNTLGELSDVSIPSTFSTGQALIWTGAAWSPGRVLDVSLDNNSINDLSDVANLPATTGQTLLWNQAEQRWEPGDVVTDGGGAATLGELQDVDTTTEPPVQNQVLLWNGFSWVPGDQTGGGGGIANGQGFSVAVEETVTTGGTTQADAEITLTELGGYGSITRLDAVEDVWVSFYATATARTADINRALGDPPAAALAGFLGEATCDAGESILLTPPLQYFNGNGTPTSEVYITLRSKAGAFADVTVTIKGFGFGVFDAISGGTFGSG